MSGTDWSLNFSEIPTDRGNSPDEMRAMANAVENYESLAIGINTVAHARGWVCYDNEFTGRDGERQCLALALAYGTRNGDEIELADGSSLYVDEYGMHAN